jgi:benzylsuccinate CoA-transferase BbsF subunit
VNLALQGIRVLDLTDAVAGPYAAMLLAMCGAEVIRIESQRHLGFRESPRKIGEGDADPRPPGDPAGSSNPDKGRFMNPNFVRYNLAKMSVALNLVKPEGRNLFKRLVAISDVVIDNLSFGVMQNWGFDYDALKQLKSDVIVATLPSFGKGQHERWTTWGMNLLSFTGFAYGWGHPETPMEERAASNTYGDYVAGTMASAMILAALYHRVKTGKGQYIEVSQTEATASLLSLSFLDYFVNHRVAPPRGNRHPQFAPYNCYPCQGHDRWCVIAVFSENEWQKFCRALDFPRWAESAKFQNMEARLKNVAELDANIEKWTRQLTPHQVMKILQSFGVASGAVQNSEDLYFDPQLRARGHMLELDLFPQGRITFDRPTLSLSKGYKAGCEGAPLLGQHNNYVYRHLLGLSQADIDNLINEKVIF